MSDCKKVFFLGAGFSKALDSSYPTMGELSEEVKDKIGQFKPVLDTYYQVEIADVMKGNVENLLTYLSSSFPFKDDVQQAMNMALYKAVVKIISDYFIEKSKNCYAKEVYFRDPLPIGNFVVSNKVDIITLNYDVLLESIIERAFQLNEWNIDIHECYKYPFIWMGHRYEMNNKPYVHPDGNSEYLRFNIFPKESADKIISILKLHGSANWYWSGMNSSDSIYYKNWSFDDQKEIDLGLIPYIVPPVLDKNAFYNHIALKFLWNEAHKLLKEAKEIYIVGFSFPQTDLSVRFMFQSALRNSEAEIYVINSDTEENLERNYKEVFGERKLIYKVGSPTVLQDFINKKLAEDK